MKIAIFLYSTIISLVIVELLLRLVKPFNCIDTRTSWTNEPIFMLNEQLIYHTQPLIRYQWSTEEFKEEGEINELGWRDSPITPITDKAYRIVVVGDSFVYGHGIPLNTQTYPKQLELHLNNLIPNVNIKVFNAGQKGYSPDQEYRLITQTILPMNPNLILWVLSDPGDLEDLTYSPEWPIPALYDIKEDSLIPLNAKFNWLYISMFVSSNTPKIVNQSCLFSIITSSASRITLLNRKPNLSPNHLRDWAIKKLVREVLNIHHLTQERNTRLIMVMIPYKKAIDRKQPSHSFTPYFKLLKSVIRSYNIDLIDLTTDIQTLFDNDLKSTCCLNNQNVMRAHSTDLNLFYYSKDVHLTPLGADIFAQFTASRLTEIITNQ